MYSLQRDSRALDSRLYRSQTARVKVLAILKKAAGPRVVRVLA